MSKVQRSFQIALVDDGSQLAWNLTSNGTISQTWFDGRANPDFETTQPTLWLVLRNGNKYENCSSTFTWKYNGEALSFDANNFNTATSSIPAGVFYKTTHTVATGVNMPALQIVKNLANSNNTNVDVITFIGSYSLEGGGSIPIEDDYQIALTEAKDGNAHQGELRATTTQLTRDNTTSVVTAYLWNPDGRMATDAFVTWWSIDNGATWTGNTSHTFTVTTSMVDDLESLICQFWPVGTSTSTHPTSGTPLWTSLLEIDDMTDEYEMQMFSIQAAETDIASANSFGTGDSARVRKDEAVKIQVYASPTEDPSTVITTFTYAYVSITDFKNEYYDDSLEGFNSVTSGHWRPVTVSSGRATQIAKFANAKTLGGSGRLHFMMTTQALT